MYLTIGVTAHRDLVATEIPVLESRVRGFLQGLQARFPDLELELLSPLAAGGDQLVARVALDLGVSLIAVLPMAQSEYERDFESSEELRRFRGLIDAAGRVVELPLHDGSELTPDATAASIRDRQYAQAGVFISNHCQVLLALWDGHELPLVGGTAQVIRYHLSAVMEGFEAPDTSAHLLADSENDLACHIVCSRDRPKGEPAAGLKPMEQYWITSQHGRLPGADMPAEYAIMLDRLQAFERDRARLEAADLEGRGLLDDELPGAPPPESARYVEALHVAADRLALKYQKRVNRGLYGIHTLAILMGLVFIVYSEYPAPDFLVWIFLALFFAGVALHVAGDRREWHRKYLDYRALAEALRVQFYWNLAGVVEANSVAFAYENFLQKQDVELGWIRHVMRAASLLRTRGEEADPAWTGWVIERWVGDTGSGGQLAYYSRKEVQNSNNYHRTEWLGRVCLWSGIGIAFILGLASGVLSESQQAILLVLMGMLPLIAGVRDTISHKKAEKELIKQYRFMARIFTNARQLLRGSTDLAFRRRVLKALGEAALEEGAEWILMHRSRPLEHQGLS
ncbi:hypothetical protein [Elongatibacter sediminis]|uniref:SMODS and SLOG-associating 2TM effector domain-containing protein n=1 Tax=Elongatibacter sediminis TaxID=3119006 RepID=A0AAW9R8J1_9GAMM